MSGCKQERWRGSMNRCQPRRAGSQNGASEAAMGAS